MIAGILSYFSSKLRAKLIRYRGIPYSSIYLIIRRLIIFIGKYFHCRFIFKGKKFVDTSAPQKNFNSENFPNYGITAVCSLRKNCFLSFIQRSHYAHAYIAMEVRTEVNLVAMHMAVMNFEW